MQFFAGSRPIPCRLGRENWRPPAEEGESIAMSDSSTKSRESAFALDREPAFCLWRSRTNPVADSPESREVAKKV